jgi:chromosome segregation ATPase
VQLSSPSSITDAVVISLSSFMNLARLVFLAAAPVSFVISSGAFAAADPTPSSEIAALEKKLSAARDELAATKTALAIAKSQAEAAEARAQTFAQTDSQLVSLRAQVRILERDLQSATAALKRSAADKTAGAPSNPLRADATEGASVRPPAAGPSPGVTVGADQKMAELQSELNNVNSRLAAAVNALEARDAEVAKLRAALAAVESRPPILATDFESARRAATEAQQRLAGVSQELTETRRQAAAARELEARVRELETEKATLLSRTAEPGISKDEFARVAAAQADAERSLAAAKSEYALLGKERDEWRAKAARVGELESRIRQLESEKTSGSTAPGDPSVRKEEIARALAAQADAESKLSTALRAFTLMTKERDELRARLAELTPKGSASQEKR